MSANYLYQIVYCSQRAGRAFRREIAISSNSAMVTGIEILPPAYDALMDRMRNPDEGVHSFAGDLKYVRDDMDCPFCGNSTTFTCPCGAISCISCDHNGHHLCPRCGTLRRVKSTERFLVSPSGFVNGQADATRRLDGSSGRWLPDPGVNDVFERHAPWNAQQPIIDVDISKPPERLRRLLPGLPGSPQDKLQDALRRGLPPAPNPEPKDLPALSWTKFLCDGSQNSDEDSLPPGPPPRKLLGDGRDTEASDSGDRIARLSDALNRNKR